MRTQRFNGIRNFQTFSSLGDENTFLLSGSGFGSITYQTANKAFYAPIQIYSAFKLANVGVRNGAVVAGNFDVAIYDKAFARLASLGSTAQAGASVIQKTALSLVMAPGLYYVGFNCDSALAATYFGITTTVVENQFSSWGVFQEAAAFPLPATATPATLTVGEARIPNVILTSLSVI